MLQHGSGDVRSIVFSSDGMPKNSVTEKILKGLPVIVEYLYKYIYPYMNYELVSKVCNDKCQYFHRREKTTAVAICIGDWQVLLTMRMG